LIVGVDPGTTTGVAALDFSGNVVGVYSSKDLGLSKVVEYILSLGTPSLIASDVKQTPHLVSKLSSKLGVKSFTPTKSLTVTEKNSLTLRYDTQDSHERDALAASIYALNHYGNKFRKIEAAGLGDEVKHKMLQGNKIGQSPAKSTPEKTKPKKKPWQTPTPPSEKDKKIKALERRVKRLSVELDGRRVEIRRLTDRLAGERVRCMGSKDPAASNAKSLKSLRAKINLLEEKNRAVDELAGLWDSLARGEVRAVGVYPGLYSGLTFVRNKLKEADATRLRKAKVVFTDVEANKKMLDRRGVRVGDSCHLNEVEGCYFISSVKLAELLEKSPDVSLEEIVEDYRGNRQST